MTKEQEMDYEVALKFYRKAADIGDRDGMCRTAICYENGKGVKKDTIKAVEYYKKVACHGVEASKNLDLDLNNNK